jgi:hypothetical protein
MQYMRIRGKDNVYSNVLTCDLPKLDPKPDNINDSRFKLYDGLIPICQAKYDDLNSLVDYLPENKRDYYRNLPTDATKVDKDAEAVAFDTESDDDGSDSE